MKILGIESTCDETAAAIVEDGVLVRSSVVASQAEIHARYRGVVPEIASRAHIENILPVIQDSLRQAGVDLQSIDGIAVTHRPGLIGSLLIGVTAAKTLAWSAGKPLIGVDHVQAHLYSVVLIDAEVLSDAGTRGRRDTEMEQVTASARHRVIASAVSPASPAFPAVGLAISGGHTALYELKSFTDIRLIGTTIDDAIGEAYDKVAFILGLGYPGGPIIDKLAATGDPQAIRFPRTLLTRDSLDFSFSGLKTSVLYHVKGKKGRERTAASLSPQEIANVAAGFQAACVDVVTTKLKRAIRAIGARGVIVGGGVSANRGLRDAISRFPVPAFFPDLQYCTDNAAMSAGLGYLKLSAGQTSEIDLDAITYSQFAPSATP